MFFLSSGYIVGELTLKTSRPASLKTPLDLSRVSLKFYSYITLYTVVLVVG